MKKLSLLLCMLIFVVGSALAQRAVKGTVVDDTGEALIGANVTVPNTTIGTITDIDGKFMLQVPEGTENIEVSFIGYTDQTLNIVGQSDLNIILSEGYAMDELVITALGTTRNSRNVVYANQSVDSEDLLSQPNKNALEALRGKVAGVKLTTGSGSVGASTKIVLRGEGSLTGNNNALIVIDGIQIDNGASRGGAGTAQDGYSDFGSRFNDLNPNDIESVTVLKGPSATSLYGSRGASGVLLITTKKGNKDNTRIGINSSFSVENAYVQLKRQDQFGQGYDGSHFDSGENWSWGPAFDGVSRPWTSPVDTDGDGALEALVRPYSAVENQIEDFFDEGKTLSNNVFMSGGKEGFTYFASYSNLNQDGILQNTGYERNTLNFKASAELTDKLTTNFGVSYAVSDIKTAQEGYRPFDGQNAYANAVQSPVNIPYSEVRDYNSPFHDLNGFYGSYSINPYFILNEFQNDGRFNNLLGNFALTYKLRDNLKLIGTIGVNNIESTLESNVPIFAYSDHLVWVDDLALTSRGGRQVSPGNYSKSKSTTTNVDAKVLVEYNHQINDDFTLDFTGGYNVFDRRVNSVSGSTVGGLVVPGYYNFDNSVQTARTTQNSSKYRIIGLLGNLKLGYRNLAFLEYSARNDWSSTLPEASNSFFYQAIGGSLILSELLEMDDNGPLNFAKLRASIGTTGKDAGLYLLQTAFIGNPTIQSLTNHDITTPLNGQPGFTVSDLIGNPDLKPELTTTYEVGADLGFFKDRISLEYTYYHSVHSDQIIQIGLAPSSGFSNTFGNVGEMTNKGHEVSLNLRPITGLVKGLTWDVNLLWATNDNEVTKVSDEVDELVVGGPFTNGAVSVVAKEGLPFGTFRSTTPTFTEAGEMIVDASGIPILSDNEVFHGSFQADYTMSFGTSVGYKGFRVNALVDMKRGGKFLSVTKNQLEFNGTALSTLENGREPFAFPNSVIEVTSEEDGSISYVPNSGDNEVLITAQDLYAVSDVYLGGESLLIDASYVKLREIGLTYDIGRLFKKNTPLHSASLGVFATNVKFWLPEENVYSDPEINGPSLTGNATGIETSQTPPSRSVGVKLNLTF